MDAKIGSGGWRKFHRFNPYREDEEKRSARIAAEWKRERMILLGMSLYASIPSVRKRASRTLEKTIRARKIPVTLPKIWGDDGTGN